MKTDKQLIDKSESEISERDSHILILVSQMVTVGITEKIPVQEMTDYIEKTYKTVSSLFFKRENVSILPAVPIRQSVKDDYLVCLEDGQRLNTLKNHLRAVHNMTPEEYRKRWGLPKDYPMTCKNYSETRSKMAKELGLGTVNRGHPLKASGKKK